MTLLMLLSICTVMGENQNENSFQSKIIDGVSVVVCDPDAFKAMASDAAIGRIYKEGKANLLVVDEKKDKRIDYLKDENLKLEKSKSFQKGILYSLSGGLIIETLILVFVK